MSIKECEMIYTGFNPSQSQIVIVILIFKRTNLQHVAPIKQSEKEHKHYYPFKIKD
jgi:hypothetical protein